MPPFDPAMQQYLETEYVAGRLTRPLDALNSLRADPRAFFARYPVQNNFDCHASGLTSVYFANDIAGGSRPGGVLGTHRMHATQAFSLQNGQGSTGGANVTVYGVYTGQSSAGPQWFTLPNAGPDIMLTAKLTGCTFVARANGQNVEVTHLQPHQETGLQLNERMLGTAGQAAYGRLKYDIDLRSINVMGVRRGGGWQIWVQKLEKHALAIRSVHRVFPPE